MKDIVWAFVGSACVFVMLLIAFKSGLPTSLGGAVLFIVLAVPIALHRRALARRRSGRER